MTAATGRITGFKLYDWGTVVPGEWDVAWKGEPNGPVSGRPKWNAVFERYVRGSSWEETGIVDLIMPDPNRPVGRWTTRQQLTDRYGRLDAVFEEIRCSGFRLAHEVGDGSFKSNLFVSIGREGALLYSKSGDHRLAMAVLLGLPLIPVYVMSRHERWQRSRDRCSRLAEAGRLTSHLSAHPDLEEFCAERDTGAYDGT